MNTNNTQAAEQHAAKRRWLNAHEEGYHKAMGNRQVQMIAIGGAIGTGLFLGAGARLQMAGPALALVYLVCGIFSFFILRALGELVLHRPSSGSFVSYAREFLGEKAAYVAGWMYFINWARTFAQPKPMPWAAPVTIATFPSRFPIFLFSFMH